MASLSQQITDLKDAINSGALKVQYDGKSVEYRSLSEMRSQLSRMEAELATTTVSSTVLAQYDGS